MQKRQPYYSQTKRYIKFLSVCNDPKSTKSVVQSAPDHVIKTICDAALNAQQGDVSLSKSQKHLFRKHQRLFKQLIDKKIPIKAKKRLIVRQKGGAFPLIPILLSTVLSSLGSLLFSNKAESSK